MEKDYEKLFAVKYVLQKEGLENFRRNRKHITEFENVFFEVVSKEPRPIRKYKISSNIQNYIRFYSLNKERLFSSKLRDIVSKKNLEDLFRNSEKKAKFGLIYNSSTKDKQETDYNAHSIFCITSEYIILYAFIGKCIMGNDKKTFNSLGSVVIKKSDLLNFSELNLEGCLYSMDEFVNSYKLCKQFNCLDKFFKSIPSKMMNEFTSLGWSDTLEDYYKEVIDSQEDLLSNNKTIDDLIKYFKNNYNQTLYSVEAKESFSIKYRFIYESFKSFIFLMTSEIKTETFESVLSGKVKNPPTQFEDPNTGRRNQGVIIVDKLYDTEINIDCPFGVRGHWRNQYYGKDAAGNPIHKRIFIEAFEKKGYHRKATKELIESK
jgi:hypothetical protein